MKFTKFEFQVTVGDFRRYLAWFVWRWGFGIIDKKERCSCKRAFAVCDRDYAMRNSGIAGLREYFARDDGVSN